MARLRYAVEQRKLGALLIGDYGTGKTYLSRVLKKICSPASHRFIFFTNPRLAPKEFLQEIIVQLGSSAESISSYSKVDLLRKVNSRLEECAHKGLHIVLVIDEAQTIKDESLLEEIRLLLNMQGDEENYFTLILLGQPQVEANLSSIPQFRQRLAIAYCLEHLDENETVEYVRHRLKIAGAERELFDTDAYKVIYEISKGMPRVINNACDLALLNGFALKKEIVDSDVMSRVVMEPGIFPTNNTQLKVDEHG